MSNEKLVYELKAVYIESTGKDIVIAEYQKQSRQDGLLLKDK